MLLIIEFINNIKQKITNKKENISLSNIIAFFFHIRPMYYWPVLGSATKADASCASEAPEGGAA